MNLKITLFLLAFLLPLALWAQPSVVNSIQCGPGVPGVVVSGAPTGSSYKWYNAPTGGTLLQTGGTTYTSSISATTVFYVSILTGASETSRSAVSATVNALPVATITPTGTTTVCPGTPVPVIATSLGAGYSYQWRLNNANISGATGLTYNAIAAGSYTMVITNTTTGCQGISAAAIVASGGLATPAVTASKTPLAICSNDSVTFSTATGFTYQWNNGSTAITGATNRTYTAKVAGSYAVTITSALGCTATSANQVVTITSGAVASIIPQGNTTICQGDMILLQAGADTNITSYQWMLNATAIPGATSKNYPTNTAGTYTLAVTGNSVCLGTSAATIITINPLPQPAVVYDSVRGILTTGIFDSYQWYLNSQLIPGATNRTDSAKITGSYTVVVTANGCSNGSVRNIVTSIPVVKLSINDAELKTRIHLFPNPASDRLTIDAPVAINVVIAGIDGKVVLQDNVSGPIDVSRLSPGLYLVKITDKQGAAIKYEKVVITH